MVKKKLGMIWILMGLVLISVACKKEGTSPPPLVEEVPEDVEESPENGRLASSLSGIYGPEEKVNRRIVAVMFDNHPKARWQAGLKDAEIIYEFQVEAPYTRYLGLYLLNDPESLGPIRSARPYFVSKVLEYDAIYVRAGGSEDAKADIKNLHIDDIDGLTNASKLAWRENFKKAPHNLYISMDIIRETQEKLGYRLNGQVSVFKFHKEDTNIEGYDAKDISIDYKQNNTTNYIYDEDKKVYIRKKDGENHIDEIDQSQIIAKNIIIQEVNTKLIDNEGRLEMDLLGTGKGKYLTNGLGIDIKWVKEDRGSKTSYYTEDGQELILNPGITWVQVVGPKVETIIE